MKNLKQIIEESFDVLPRSMDYPIQRELLSYPINLIGQYCELDCDARSRRLAIEAAARTKPAAVREYIQKLDQAMDKTLAENFRKVVVSYRQADLSEYMIEEESLHGGSSRLKEEIAYVKSALRSDPAVISMDAGLTAMEYVTGLRKEPAQIPKQVLDVCAREFHQPFDWEAYQTGRTTMADGLTTLEIHMEDTSWYPQFMAMTDLKLYVPETHPEFSPPSARDYDAYLEQFSLSTYRRELSFYETLEQQELYLPGDDEESVELTAGDDKKSGEPVTREDLIFIDGVSLKDWTNYSMELHPAATSREAVSAALLSQALSNSEHYVECYLPDNENRTIRTEPVRLTQEGIKPAEMEKPSMNAWQRFWSKHGHFRELAAQKEHYDTIAEFRQQSAESIKTLSGSLSAAWEDKAVSQSLESCKTGVEKAEACKTALGVHLFGEEYAAARGGVSDSTFFQLRRSGTNLGICMLLREGLTLEEIMDPEKEPEKKRAAGEELKAMALRNDPKELLSIVAPAIDHIMALPNIDMDYTDFTQAPSHALEISVRGCLFDLYQEAGRTGDTIREMMGREESDAFLDRAQRYGAFYHRLDQCMESVDVINSGKTSDRINAVSYLGQYQAFVRDFGPQMNGGAAPDRLPDLHTEIQFAIQTECADRESKNEDLLNKQLTGLLRQGLSGRPVAEVVAPTAANPNPTVRLAGMENAPQKTAPAAPARTK